MTDACKSEDDCTQMPWCKIRGACQVAVEHEPHHTLADLKVGDEVVYISGTPQKPWLTIANVTHVTPKKIRVMGCMFFKETGRGMSGVGSVISLEQKDFLCATGQMVERERKQKRYTALVAEQKDTELRQREALERVERYVVLRKEMKTVGNLVDVAFVAGSSECAELHLSDLIEVVKMARRYDLETRRPNSIRTERGRFMAFPL